ncbi:hypothetical protein PT2222_500004 [Paraburkholderia tropica]
MLGSGPCDEELSKVRAMAVLCTGHQLPADAREGGAGGNIRPIRVPEVPVDRFAGANSGVPAAQRCQGRVVGKRAGVGRNGFGLTRFHGRQTASLTMLD